MRSSVSADSQLGSHDQYYLLRYCYINTTTSEVDSVAASLLLLHKVFYKTKKGLLTTKRSFGILFFSFIKLPLVASE
jgi:hypothetical protein